jgi:hypothetical protein
VTLSVLDQLFAKGFFDEEPATGDPDQFATRGLPLEVVSR